MDTLPTDVPADPDVEPAEVRTWVRAYGPLSTGVSGIGSWTPISIRQTPDDGFLLAARIDPGPVTALHDMLLLRLDAGGDPIWQKSYGGSETGYVVSLERASGGGYISAGGLYVGRAYDIWVGRIDEGGDPLWQRLYRGSGTLWLHGFAQASDGGYVLAGEMSIAGTADDDFLVLKIGPHGEIEWQKRYGESRSDCAHAVVETMDGGYIVAGENRSQPEALHHPHAWILKLDESGDAVWQRIFRGEGDTSIRAIVQVGDGGYLAMGEIFGYRGHDLWIVRLDRDGDSMWQRAVGGSWTEEMRSLQRTVDGGFVIGGRTTSFGAGTWDLWVLRIDPDGEVMWQKAFGDEEWDLGCSVQSTSDGGFIVVGYTELLRDRDYDIIVLKLDDEGNVPAGCTEVSSVDTDAEVIPTYLTSEATYIEPLSPELGIHEWGTAPAATSLDVALLCGS